jgi:DNA-directed RNA polymerase subunit RPC12/RpoP
MISGSTCPECGGRVTTEDGLDYGCEDCRAEFDVVDLFVH